MFDAKDTLLPPTATPLAKALDILEERLFSLPVQMISKDPATVDVGLLDHLAWEHSVDVWDLKWPEDIKRKLIASSAEVHRFKGTPHAIFKAFDVVGVDAELIEWFDEAGLAAGMPRGTFRVTGYAKAGIDGRIPLASDQRSIQTLREFVERAAPVSRGLYFGVGDRVAVHGKLRLGARDWHREKGCLAPKPRLHVAKPETFTRLGARDKHRERGALAPKPRTNVATIGAVTRLGLRDRAVLSAEFTITPRFGAAYAR